MGTKKADSTMAIQQAQLTRKIRPTPSTSENRLYTSVPPAAHRTFTSVSSPIFRARSEKNLLPGCTRSAWRIFCTSGWPRKFLYSSGRLLSDRQYRSEEHTSELQSHGLISYAV